MVEVPRYCVQKMLYLLVVAGLVLAFVSCAFEGPTAEPTAPSEVEGPAAERLLTLGIMGPFSGPSESTGREFKGAATMAFDAIDWQIGKYTIEPVWIDSQSDPDLAAKAYEHAVVEDGIQAGILNWHSSVAVECMDVAAQHNPTSSPLAPPRWSTRSSTPTPRGTVTG